MPGANGLSGTGARRRGTPSSAPRAPRSKLAADGPEVGEERLVQRRAQVVGAVAARSDPRADRPLDHLHVVVAPLHEALVEVDEALGDLRGRSVVTVRLE